jgi:predicted branched-subunit amino acid permease
MMELSRQCIASNQKQNESTYTDFLQGVKDCVPTIFGYLSIGFTCGVVSKSLV